jgi:hypothetical protein
LSAQNILGRLSKFFVIFHLNLILASRFCHFKNRESYFISRSNSVFKQKKIITETKEIVGVQSNCLIFNYRGLIIRHLVNIVFVCDSWLSGNQNRKKNLSIVNWLLCLPKFSCNVFKKSYISEGVFRASETCFCSPSFCLRSRLCRKDSRVKFLNIFKNNFEQIITWQINLNYLEFSFS